MVAFCKRGIADYLLSDIRPPHKGMGLPNLTIRFSWLFPLRVFCHLSRCSPMTCIPDRPTAQAVSFPPSKARTSCTDSQQDYVQPTKLVLRIDGFMPKKAIFLNATPYQLSWFKLYLPFALFTTLLRRVRLSQGIRQLCGMYIISHVSGKASC